MSMGLLRIVVNDYERSRASQAAPVLNPQISSHSQTKQKELDGTVSLAIV